MSNTGSLSDYIEYIAEHGLDAEVKSLDLDWGNIPSLFFDLSQAYIDSSTYICNGMASNSFDQNFSRSRVVFHLCHHSIELFYKGAIFQGTQSVPDNTHNLFTLQQKFTKYYSNKKYSFQIPFQIVKPYSCDDKTYTKISKQHFKALDQKFRYYTDSKGQLLFSAEWFNSNSFLTTLEKLKEDFTKLIPIILDTRC